MLRLCVLYGSGSAFSVVTGLPCSGREVVIMGTERSRPPISKHHVTGQGHRPSRPLPFCLRPPLYLTKPNTETGASYLKAKNYKLHTVNPSTAGYSPRGRGEKTQDALQTYNKLHFLSVHFDKWQNKQESRVDGFTTDPDSTQLGKEEFS